MTVFDVVDILARNKEIEKIIMKVTNDSKEDTLNDLAQDLYMSILEKGDKVVKIYEEGHIMYYLARLVMNNIASSSSPYYRTYLKWYKQNCEFDQNILTEDIE